MTGCVWCKGRTLLDHDCRNFAHLEPENVEELCITCQGVGQLREFDQRHPRPCPDCKTMEP